MPFEKIQSEKLSQSVVDQIELLVLRGILRPGERLPSERDLSERMGVSRPSLRDAISQLNDSGVLESKAGSGIFISDQMSAELPDALANLFANHSEAIFDYLSFRRDVEAMMAERAAKYGSDTDLQVVDTIFQQMQAAHAKQNSEEEARLDAEFHLAIVEAAHNSVMLHMMRAMFKMLREGVFYNRQVMFNQRTTREVLLEQHDAINAAIQMRDPAKARKAVETHLDFVHQALSDQQKADKNEVIAKKRLERRNSH